MMVGRNPEYAPTSREADDEYIAEAVEKRVNEQLERHAEETPDRFASVDKALSEGRAVSEVGSTHFSY